jgi:hypothetical protein
VKIFFIFCELRPPEKLGEFPEEVVKEKRRFADLTDLLCVKLASGIVVFMAEQGSPRLGSFDAFLTLPTVCLKYEAK